MDVGSGMQVVWLSVDPEIPADEYWDQSLFKELLKDCNHHYGIGDLKEAIVIIPGAYLGKDIDKINTELAKLDKCKVIITSDEENDFPIDELKHPNMKIYANYLTDKYQSDITWLPIGPAKIVEIPYEPKTISWLYAGQVNHDSRRKLVKILQGLTFGELYTSKGFAQGLEQGEYYKKMASARAVPAPRGNISPDSFRFYEALELGAVPIPEDREFWFKMFPDMPIEVAENWADVDYHINLINSDREYRNQCIAWWHRKKLEIKDDLLGQPDTTVVVPVSAIKSHPSTEIVDETIASIKHQLPDARIIVTFDGVREEYKGRHEDYQEFIERFLRKHNNKNIYPVIFGEHTHQVGMMRAAMKYIESPYIVYVEQDTPFTDDYIDWDGCKRALKRVDLIRFHFEASIPEPHQYLMQGTMSNTPVPLMRTTQYSQRPHITAKSFYQKMLANFTPNAKSFIEDKMHGVCQNEPKSYRLAIYHPEGNIKRTRHTDGRAGEAKLDDTQIF